MDFQLYRTFPAELESGWNALLDETATHVPFLRYEYLEAWWQTRGGGEWPESAEPMIVIARKEGRLAGIAPLFLTDRQGVPSLLLLGSSLDARPLTLMKGDPISVAGYLIEMPYLETGRQFLTQYGHSLPADEQKGSSDVTKFTAADQLLGACVRDALARTHLRIRSGGSPNCVRRRFCKTA